MIDRRLDLEIEDITDDVEEDMPRVLSFQEQRLNEYVAMASEAQNRANELQICYFRIQKENDENKQSSS